MYSARPSVRAGVYGPAGSPTSQSSRDIISWKDDGLSGPSKPAASGPAQGKDGTWLFRDEHDVQRKEASKRALLAGLEEQMREKKERGSGSAPEPSGSVRLSRRRSAAPADDIPLSPNRSDPRSSLASSSSAFAAPAAGRASSLSQAAPAPIVASSPRITRASHNQQQFSIYGSEPSSPSSSGPASPSQSGVHGRFRLSNASPEQQAEAEARFRKQKEQQEFLRQQIDEKRRSSGGGVGAGTPRGRRTKGSEPDIMPTFEKASDKFDDESVFALVHNRNQNNQSRLQQQQLDDAEAESLSAEIPRLNFDDAVDEKSSSSMKAPRGASAPRGGRASVGSVASSSAAASSKPSSGVAPKIGGSSAAAGKKPAGSSAAPAAAAPKVGFGSGVSLNRTGAAAAAAKRSSSVNARPVKSR